MAQNDTARPDPAHIDKMEELGARMAAKIDRLDAEIERLRSALMDVRKSLRETPLATIWMTERINAVLGEKTSDATT